MCVVRGSQQQRGGVHRAAGDDHEWRLHAEGLTVPFDVDSVDLSAAAVGDQPSRVRARPQRHVRLQHCVANTTDFGVALRADLARK